MTIHVALNHRTSYTYDRPVTVSPQVIRLRPCVHTRASILSYSLKILPEGHFLNWQQDPQGNWLARAVFPDKVSQLSVEVDLVAEMAVYNPFDFFLEPDAEQIPFAYDASLSEELAPFLKAEAAGPLLAAYVAAIDRTPLRTIDFLVGLNQRLQRDIGYVIRLEPGVQACEESLAKRTGSCRDSAWLLVQVLRHLGLAARFVSGYLIQLVPDQKPLDGPEGPATDFTDLHAWTEVYLPGAGWIGLDPTSGLMAGEGHIPLACSPEPGSAAPLTGAVELCEVGFDYAMSVTRVAQSPRVTKPYDEDQWQAILALGDSVDAKLTAGDVRLTMGGEPTFVSVDDMEGAEWNIAAVGPTKRQRAYELIMRLRQTFAPEGLLSFGQGKWYPGEPLPRWAFALYWRGDGQPLWRDAKLVADESVDYQPTPEQAQTFLTTLCARLDLDPSYILPAFEDPLHYVRREQELPVNVSTLDSKLTDAQERARLAQVFRQGLDKPVGYALPLQRWNAAHSSNWVTGPWPFRDNKMFLLPGDSPLGFRLPLESLPWIDEADYPYFMPADPFAPRGTLPARPAAKPPQRFTRAAPPAAARQVVQTQAAQTAAVAAKKPPVRTERGLVGEAVRTALCIQPRDGRLCLFLPPTEQADDFVALVNAIEDTAAELGLPVHVEGYSPPEDSRLNVVKVTPDPGVLEVNIHPAHSWRQLVGTTTAVYEEARQTRLGAEKFMVDGRHVGTGGGNHIVVGGATAADSPFLRRPDVLGSLIRYWQNHPSLSYLFSGLFIGPTSQAPRIDEARDDAVYELELALRQLPQAGVNAAPWLVDRVLRNILVDVTGNTHRTEICIDKLYSPDGPTGRLGLVEFRSFEMPPHARMSCAQQLLLRALIARFWDQPYERPLVRWGAALRDRFLLPHHVAQDFHDVIADMRDHGFAFDPGWFAPHIEFRFPRYGAVTQEGVTLELRQALEPWHVLGEEPGPGGTVRYVDSSVERLQVKVNGLFGGRYQVACNQVLVPLQPTGTAGEYVAGVRFRAWQPSSCLHPTIGVHAPLVFDIVDSWSARAIGGCTYHVTHPGGRSYDTFPVNANEAESRRLSRFFPFGHSPGSDLALRRLANPDFPSTLDLRLGAVK